MSNRDKVEFRMTWMQRVSGGQPDSKINVSFFRIGSDAMVALVVVDPEDERTVELLKRMDGDATINLPENFDSDLSHDERLTAFREALTRTAD